MWKTPKNKNKKMKKGLLKIGQLAKKVGVLPSTINFYTNEGLLKEAGRSRGGYRLYEESYAISQIKKIQRLQFEKRLRIKEIRKYLSS
jgi:MerR family Zn(II)-responsive transcriptional regulator of zntA